MLCYDGPYPDKRELTLINVADMQSSRSCLHLADLKLICFVSHRTWSDQSKICFLAYDYSQPEQNQVVFCIVNSSKMFQKKLNRDLSFMDV